MPTGARPAPRPVSPCGRCRQVINEAAQMSGTDLPVICGAAEGDAVGALRAVRTAARRVRPADLGIADADVRRDSRLSGRCRAAMAATARLVHARVERAMRSSEGSCRWRTWHACSDLSISAPRPPAFYRSRQSPLADHRRDGVSTALDRRGDASDGSSHAACGRGDVFVAVERMTLELRHWRSDRRESGRGIGRSTRVDERRRRATAGPARMRPISAHHRRSPQRGGRCVSGAERAVAKREHAGLPPAAGLAPGSTVRQTRQLVDADVAASRLVGGGDDRHGHSAAPRPVPRHRPARSGGIDDAAASVGDAGRSLPSDPRQLCRMFADRDLTGDAAGGMWSRLPRDR